jgi:hypothetical protein
LLLSHAFLLLLLLLSSCQVMTSTRLGQGAKFFHAEELRDNHGRLQPAPPIVLGPMAPGGGLPAAQQQSAAMRLADLAKKPLTVQVRCIGEETRAGNSAVQGDAICAGVRCVACRACTLNM